jgi:multiple sugar transport system substrate-binding protein
MFSHARRLLTTRAAVCLLAVGALLLSACGSGDDAGQQASGDGKLTGSLEIVWPGTSDPEKQVAQDFAAEMAKQDIKIEYTFLSWRDMQQQLAVRVQANDPPDITMTQDVTDLVRLGALEPLGDYLADSGIDTKSFSPGSLEYSTIDGRLYALPYLAQAFTLIVNEKMLGDAGMKVADLKTWADVEKAAAAMTKDGKYGFAYPAGNPRFAFRVPLTIGYSNGVNIGAPDPADEAKWKELLDHMAKLTPSRPPADKAWDYPEMWQAYAKGEVGMIVAGTYFTANLYPLNPGIIGQSVQLAYPAGPSADKALAPVSNAGYGIFAGSKNKELAWHVLKQLASDKWTARLAAVVNTPARSSVSLDALKPEVQQVYPDAVDGQMKQLENNIDLIKNNGTPLKQIPGQPEMEPELQEVMLQFLDGKVGRDEAYSLLQERLSAVAKSG